MMRNNTRFLQKIVGGSHARSSMLRNARLISAQGLRFASTFKTNYDGMVAERATMGIVPKPLDAEQTGKLVEMLKSPPAGEEAFLMDFE